MESRSIFVGAISWEERSSLGVKRVSSGAGFANALFIRFEEWSDWTVQALEDVSNLCDNRNITHEEIVLSYRHPERTWQALRDVLWREVRADDDVVVDISTMPRETIWTVFFFLQAIKANVRYVYHKPNHYSREWLSRDPERPRFVFQMSGEARLGLETVLLVATGFDAARTEQLIRTFEPSKTILALQSGDQFNNVSQNVNSHYALVGGPAASATGVQSFDVDAYSPDHGQSVIEEHMATYIQSANVLCASLGPKLSAVALYKLNRRYPQAALVYAPSGEYHREYSGGIGESLWGRL